LLLGFADFLQILLLSPPLSYPLPLLSLTTHLALLSTRLPALLSQGDEDPLFNDDWEASTYLYPRRSKTSPSQKDEHLVRPPITLLVTTVGPNILFDPSRDELAVAETVLAISAAQTSAATAESSGLKVVAMRTIDPPSRLTAAGVPRDVNSVTGAAATASASEVLAAREKDEGRGVWRAPRGGVRRGVVTEAVKLIVAKGGVGEEVLGGLEGVET
jgi:exosome complex component RRP42